jgi:hypothetical protein
MSMQFRRRTNRSGGFLLVLANTVLFSGLVGTHGHIVVSFKTFTCFEMGSPFRGEEGSDNCWSFPLSGGDPSGRAVTH